MKIIGVEIVGGIPHETSITDHPRARSVAGAIRARFRTCSHFGPIRWCDGEDSIPIYSITPDGVMLPPVRKAVLGNRDGIMCRVV